METLLKFRKRERTLVMTKKLLLWQLGAWNFWVKEKRLERFAEENRRISKWIFGRRQRDHPKGAASGTRPIADQKRLTTAEMDGRPPQRIAGRRRQFRFFWSFSSSSRSSSRLFTSRSLTSSVHGQRTVFLLVFLFPPYRVSRGSAFSCSLALLSEKNAEGPFRFHR